MKTHDIYLAGPFFTPEQKEACAEIKAALIAAGLSVCDPQEINPVIKELPEAERKEELFRRIFEGNISGMDEARGIVLLTDDKDTGTSFEFGYFFGTKGERPIVTVSLKGKAANVMLAQAADLHCAKYDDFVEALPRIVAAVRDGSPLESRRAVSDE